jgi:hypothetical protein
MRFLEIQAIVNEESITQKLKIKSQFLSVSEINAKYRYVACLLTHKFE